MVTLLVVDDHKSTRELISQYFSDKGYQVYTAINLDSVRHLLLKVDVDVAVVDVRLEGYRQGLDVLSELKSQRRQTVVIVTTAHIPTSRTGAMSLMEEAKRLGADDFIEKSNDLCIRIDMSIAERLSFERVLPSAASIDSFPVCEQTVSVIPSLAELRSFLQYLDDVQLDALCLDNFPAVYDTFSRGLRRDEKINLLLDYCHRNSEAAVRLAAHLTDRLTIHTDNIYFEYPQRATATVSYSPTSTGLNLPTGPIRNRWALLVGVNTYIDPVFPLLKYCVRDVLALQVTLEAAGYTVIALHDDAPAEHLWPTRDNTEAELTRICEAAGPDDLIWVHFSCHGKLIAGRPFLVTREIRAPTMAKKALSLAQVEALMRESKCRRRVLTLDACHTGVEIGRDLADPEFIRNVYELAEGFVLLAASTSQQIAQEWSEKEHGAFTYFLLQGLRREASHASKGFITVNDLALQALDGLRCWNVTHGGILQEPTARTEGLGDMILIDFRDFDDE